ncbi:MAG: dihydrodipicolinate synthase family protein [Marinilabiliales bacterium]|nr:dihydrodipicolinate synthase family protein [Marinilabiliales bacterium]
MYLGRTSVNIKAETTLRLANDFKNIIAVKEAAGDMSQAMYLVKDKPKDFQIISGEDALTLPHYYAWFFRCYFGSCQCNA